MAKVYPDGNPFGFKSKATHTRAKREGTFSLMVFVWIWMGERREGIDKGK